jgi:predicted metal-dependent hydrolase
MFDLFRKAKSNAPEQLRWGDRSIAIQRRKGRRGLRLVIELDGTIRVLANQSATAGQLHQFLRMNELWIERVSDRFQKERQRFPKKLFQAGELFPYQDQELRLNYTPTFRKTWRAVIIENELRVFVPLAIWTRDFANHPHPEAAPIIARLYRTQAREVLAERVKLWSARTGLQPQALIFRGQKTRWGSMSSRGHLSLNWKLIAAPLHILDYVIIHELCHIRHHNHSKNFWALVAHFDPDCQSHRVWLRKNQMSFDFLKGPHASPKES